MFHKGILSWKFHIKRAAVIFAWWIIKFSNSVPMYREPSTLTVHQAGIGPLQLQNNVNHRLQEGCVPAVALERKGSI